MSPAAWGAVVAAIGTAGAVLVELIRTRRTAAAAAGAASTAADAATTAAERVRPVANGFAGEVLDRLAALGETTTANAKAIDTLRELSEDKRQHLLAVEELARQTAGRLSDHIAEAQRRWADAITVPRQRGALTEE